MGPKGQRLQVLEKEEEEVEEQEGLTTNCYSPMFFLKERSTTWPSLNLLNRMGPYHVLCFAFPRQSKTSIVALLQQQQPWPGCSLAWIDLRLRAQQRSSANGHLLSWSVKLPIHPTAVS
jgi:hypothetical protein